MDIFSVSILGPTGSGIKLHALGPNSDVDLFQISPDSRRVVYCADQDTDQINEIFSVPIEGGTPGIKLNGPLLPDESVVPFFQVSPDSSRVVYVIYRIFALQNRDLISVSMAGPVDGIVNLSTPMTAGGSVRDYQISPDSSRVVFQADKQTAGVYELFSVPLGGPAAAVFKVNGPLATGGNAGLFQISRDSGRVIYIADQDTNDLLELYMTSNYSIHLPLILNK
jgi:Tol biopolymer transport system component